MKTSLVLGYSRSYDAYIGPKLKTGYVYICKEKLKQYVGDYDLPNLKFEIHTEPADNRIPFTVLSISKYSCVVDVNGQSNNLTMGTSTFLYEAKLVKNTEYYLEVSSA